MNTAILGLGTSVPDHCMSQEDALALFQDIVCETERQRRLGQVLFRKSHVENRHLTVPHLIEYSKSHSAGNTIAVGDRSLLATLPDEVPILVANKSVGPTTGERMGLYAELAGDLAFQSAKVALRASNLPGSAITHLVVVTCTGFNSPGVDIELIQRLGLPNTTQRINVGFMGCHAAINGLRTALAITQADATAKVLLCCVELCSLHFPFQWDDEGIVGNALFADGSASLVLGQTKADDLVAVGDPDCSWELIDSGSVLIPDSTDEMSWKIGDHGFEMKLTSGVSDAIENALRDWLVDWLAGHDLTLDDIDHWGVHPGGPKILAAVENSLELEEEQLKTSRSILKHYGNMSSPTVLFILNEFMTNRFDSPTDKPANCLLLAFGPGLVAEVALIQTT